MTANYFISKEYFNPDDLKNLENTTKYKKHLLINKFDNDFYIVKYNKLYKKQLDNTAKLFRSVIFKNNKCVGFSPPKSISMDNFKTKHNICDVKIEQFIDGTMINLFYDEKYNWQICTKSTIGANSNFNLDSNYTYREMFIQAMKKSNLNLDYLDIRFSYSFILQHPENRIVSFVENPQLYLIAIYEITNTNIGIIIEEFDIHNYYKKIDCYDDLNNSNNINSNTSNTSNNYKLNNLNNNFNKYNFLNTNKISFNKYQFINPNIFHSDYTYKHTYVNELLLATDKQLKIPRIFDNKNLNEQFETYEKLITTYSSSNKLLPLYSHMGLILKFGNDRTKIRNPNYNEIKLMKGNDRYIKNTYFRLRRNHQIKKYLKCFSENNEIFSDLNNKVKEVTMQLYHIYCSFFIMKKISSADLQPQFKYHIYNIHKQYIQLLRPQKRHVEFRTVINYINCLEPYKLQNLID